MQYTNETPAKFVGGLNVRRRWFWLTRVNATWPLARLVVDHHGIHLALIGPLRRLVDRRFAREDVAAFRVRPWLLPTGVGFELPGGEIAFFWTFRRGLVLDVLAGRGYRVTEPRRVSWRHLLGG